MADADELDRNARDLLAAYRNHAGPSPEAADRLLAAVRRSAAAQGPAAPDAPLAMLATPRARSAASTRRWIGVTIAGLLAAAVVAALRLAPESVAPRSRDANTAAPHSADVDAAPLRTRPGRPGDSAAADARPHHEPVPGDSLDAPLAPGSRSGADAAASSRAPVAQRRPDFEPVPPAPSPGGSLAQELAFMRMVNAELAAGAPQQAIDLLVDYPRRFPDGLLREESEALRALAGCSIRLDDASTAVAAAFLRAHPGSMSHQRVRSACALP